MTENSLTMAVKKVLASLEEQGEIVVCSSIPEKPAKALVEKIETFIPNEKLTTSEMVGLRALIYHAVTDERFFDWEMPTLTGLSADEFRNVAEKLPKG